MSTRLRAAALALAGALAACGNDEVAPAGLLLSEPSAAAVFHGVTVKEARVRPYLAIANASSNDLTIVDAVTNVAVPAPLPLRTLVYPVPGRPVLLASARLGDGGGGGEERPDLLVAVSAGDSKLQLVTTWAASGEVAGTVDLGGDILAIVAVPSPVGTARIAAALSGRRVAVAEFRRAGPDPANAPPPFEIVPAATSVAPVSTPGVQLLALAAMPGAQDRIWGATADENGVAELAIAGDGTPSFSGTILDAGGPTRLVAAARLAERGTGEAGLDPDGWTTLAPVERVYAILDESGCGPGTGTSCGLVALDPSTGTRAPGFAAEPGLRAALAIPGSAVAIAASGPPAVPPSTAPADQLYAPPFMRIWPGTGPVRTTGVAAVASTDGAIYFVDLARWELPSNQLVHRSVGASVTPVRAPAASGAADQWLVLIDPDLPGTVVPHLDPVALSTAVTLTPGFTPSERWTVAREGVLPGLSSRRAEAGGSTWIALQAGGGTSEVVAVEDPAVGIRAGATDGDLVVVTDPAAVGSCAPTFEARVVGFEPPAAGTPGGALTVVAAEPRWAECVTGLAGKPNLRATVRAGGYVLVRGTGAGAAQVGRPELGVEFVVTGATAPRISYVPERCETPPCAWTLPDPVGPALAFTLALETGAGEPRDLSLVIDTREGRTPFRGVDPLGAAIGPRGITVFDRSPTLLPASAAAGVRFIVPYGTNVVLDATPTQAGGSVAHLR
jgi:hypothetical protein